MNKVMLAYPLNYINKKSLKQKIGNYLLIQNYSLLGNSNKIKVI